MVTGQDSTEFEIKGYEYGIVSFIKKPYQVDVDGLVVQNNGLGNNFRPFGSMGLYQFKLVLVELAGFQYDTVRNGNLADVMKQR